MILSNIKEYFSEHPAASLSDLSIRFNVEPDAMRGMLELWVRKGKLRKVNHNSSCSNCCSDCKSDHMEIYALCCDCKKQQKPLMPISMGSPGERLIIMEMRAGKRARARLTSLGLQPGDQVEIINNNNNGRLVIGHNNTRIAIGRGIGEKILVAVDH